MTEHEHQLAVWTSIDAAERTLSFERLVLAAWLSKHGVADEQERRVAAIERVIEALKATALKGPLTGVANTSTSGKE